MLPVKAVLLRIEIAHHYVPSLFGAARAPIPSALTSLRRVSFTRLVIAAPIMLACEHNGRPLSIYRHNSRNLVQIPRPWLAAIAVPKHGTLNPLYQKGV